MYEYQSGGPNEIDKFTYNLWFYTIPGLIAILMENACDS